MAGRKAHRFELSKHDALAIQGAQFEVENLKQQFEIAVNRRDEIAKKIVKTHGVDGNDYNFNLDQGALVRKANGEQS